MRTYNPGMLLTLTLATAPLLSIPQSDDAAAQAAREAAFAKLLSGATLVGHTTITDGDGKLVGTDLKEDSYTLKEVVKGEDGKWTFKASMSFGGMSLPISVALPVHWAGDTPVITVDEMKFAMMGTYSARVVFQGNQYVGVWSGDGYGGHIFGRVVSAVPEAELDVSAENTARSIHWPSFRGKNASGVAHGHATIESFDVETGENVLWRIDVPGLSHSSPVIHGDDLFLTTSIPVEGDAELTVGWMGGSTTPVEDEPDQRYELLCYDKNTGELKWRREVWQGTPAVKRHPKSSHAAATPTVDADRVIVQCDVQDQSFVAMLDAGTGEEVWRTNRENSSGWSTPTVHVDSDRSQVICNGWQEIAGYELSSGTRLWTTKPGGDLPVPTPVTGAGNVFITNAHGRGGSPIYAIDLDANGDVGPGSKTEEPSEFMKWSVARRGSYMPTPIVVGDLFFVCRDNGILACYDASTGEEHFSERLDDGNSVYTSSPVSADGKIYCISEDGMVTTVRAGTSLEVIARSMLDEKVLASPALSEGVLYVRSQSGLFALGAKEASK